MKPILKIIIIICLFINYTTILTSCKKKTEPTVTTDSISTFNQTTATSGGNVTNNGGAGVTARGVCWSTTNNPTFGPNSTSDGSGNGHFNSYIEGLTSNTMYYVRAYAVNSKGIGYGDEVSFKTKSILPISLTTTALTSITATTAVSGGNITSDGGGNITARGVCWNTSGSPTVLDTRTTDGMGTGIYTSYLTGLMDGTIYYVRAYATNEEGTSYYGEQYSFITPVTDIEGNVYKTVKIGTQVWMAENLKTTRLNNDISIPNIVNDNTWINLTSPGYCWYDNLSSYKDIYGALYNWYTVNTGRLCPSGWHVPADHEWEELVTFVGEGTYSESREIANKLKEAGFNLWESCPDGNNESGFSARPGGKREYSNGEFRLLHRETWWWAATGSTNSDEARCFFVYCVGLQFNDWNFQAGMSVRCLKN